MAARRPLIQLQARQFFCGNDACAKATFAERAPGLTIRYGRRTCGLQTGAASGRLPRAARQARG